MAPLDIHPSQFVDLDGIICTIVTALEKETVTVARPCLHHSFNLDRATFEGAVEDEISAGTRPTKTSGEFLSELFR
jgi:hypothetical protein